LKRSWCIGKVDGLFLAQMERLLWLYALAYDAAYPVICFDERPCFLIGEEVEPLSMQSGKVAKQHYAYEKNGSCALLAAIEPLTGKRLATVYQRRTKKEYALFLKALADSYPEAVKIRLVQDNLNTHNASSFYEHFPAQEAFALSQRFEFYYTPKAASWLNMIEIEFSALVKQCLDRRIPTQEQLSEEILAIVKERNDKQIKINWQFSIKAARSKLNSAYTRVNPINKKYKET
jgi:DDE superfamily endonuclease